MKKLSVAPVMVFVELCKMIKTVFDLLCSDMLDLKVANYCKTAHFMLLKTLFM